MVLTWSFTLLSLIMDPKSNGPFVRTNVNAMHLLRNNDGSVKPTGWINRQCTANWYWVARINIASLL